MKYALLFVLLAVAACAAPAEPMDEHNDMDGMDHDDMNPSEETTEPVEPTEPAAENGREPDVTFVVTGDNFNFYHEGVTRPDLRVNQGDLVRIEFESVGGFHDWVVDEFNAATEKVRDGDGMVAVEFVADETGTFEYYCSVGSHRANGMVGNLIVE